MKYIVKGNYYVDIDHLHQLRITGPGNHLLCGLTLPTQAKVEMDAHELEDGELEVHLEIFTSQMQLHYPLVTDIRTLRSLTEPVVPTPNYRQLIESNAENIMPEFIDWKEVGDAITISCTNTYHDENAFTYGCELEFSASLVTDKHPSYVELTTTEDSLHLTIRTISNITVESIEESSLFLPRTLPTDPQLDQYIYALYDQLGQDIEHLVRTKKTSSFEYGTIFPRDWVEAADLGEDDFTPKTVDFMYEQSMKYVSDKGEGWHEEIIGQYKTRVKSFPELVDRKMIDIEPHYILGLTRLSHNFLSREDVHQKFISIAHFVVLNANEQRLISFKRLPDTEGFYFVGNWRDSENAFPNQTSPLSPYDVNCVFYPEALRQIKAQAEYLQQTDLDMLDTLIEKWDRNKERFRLYHDDKTVGYSLALHGKKNLPLPIAHIDESFDLFYNRPSIEEVDSFARKVVDPSYFFTPVGPILVDAESSAYTTRQYHGKVIWPKQVAFVVAGLARQYRYGVRNSWPEIVLKHIRTAIIKTSEASFLAWKTLESVPELYYFNEQTNTAQLYTQQENYEGQMSLVQLWSAVGARRIIREYLRIIKSE